MREPQAKELTGAINSSTTGSNQLTEDVAQRSQDDTEITSLQQTVQDDQLNTLSIVQATRVLTPGTSVYHSAIKLIVVDGLSGFGIGLVIALGFVLLQALASDRVRRREDVSALVGTSVEVSARPLRHTARASRWRSKEHN